MDLTKGSLRKQMITFAVPLILTSVFKQSFSFVDTLIVARFCNPESLSSISLASSLYSLLASFVNGFGVACSVVMGKVYGTKQDKTTKDTTYTLVFLGAGLSLLLALSCILIAPYYVKQIQTPTGIVSLTCNVLQLYSVDILFYGVSLVASCLLNGLGDSKNPFRISTLSSLLNITLDLIAVAIFHTGVIGCVITTLISQIISAICMIICLVRKMHHINTRISFRVSVISETFAIGSTSIVQESLFNVLAILAQSVVTPYGVHYINGYSIGRQIFSIFSTGINGYNRAYSTALSHNYGAKQFERIHEAKKVARIDGNMYSAHNLLYLTASRAKYRLLVLGSKVNGISPCLSYAIDGKYFENGANTDT